jgi:glyoxylase-like metal-dependent hydrolase (beta-lactamase superfamily II)
MTAAPGGASGAQTADRAGAGPAVTAFFHEPTKTVSYLVADPAAGRAAVIDSVLDFGPIACRTGTAAADAILAAVEGQGRRVDRILETHAHADHLSAAPYLKDKLGARIGIGERIRQVQAAFGDIYNLGDRFPRDGSQFDHLFADGERFRIGRLEAEVLHTPGHTPACVSYLVGDALFVGDTMFMPDYGTARCDFPGGSAEVLYRSIRRLLALPPETRVFVCHDYAPGGRPYAWETTVGAQRASNVHVRDGIDEATFAAMRRERDATLDLPDLILPSVQVNIRAGRLPEPESNGVSYLKMPLNVF